MTVYSIYDHPRDYPEHFVVRRWSCDHSPEPVPDRAATLHASLDGARDAIPDGLVCVGRQPDDDPVIVESWL